jgi:cysteine-rich repeat protein
MNLKMVFVSVSALLTAIVASQGCTPPGAQTLNLEDRICVPGDYVFCRCADRAEGTKLCKADAKSFEPCTTNDNGECVGGEVPDPRTNEPVSPDASSEQPQIDAAPPPINPLDECPGKSTAVQGGVEVKLEGDTTTATTDRKGNTGACAAGVGANDHLYHLIPTASGSLVVKVQGSNGLDPVVYLRSDCADETSQLKCAAPTPSKLVQLQENVLAGRDYFLVIDGASSSVGTYVATLDLTPGPFCGDSKVDPNEACDDGNKVEGDGCSNSCTRVDGNPTSGGSCPGQPVDVWSGQTVIGTGSTNGYAGSWNAPSSTACGVTATGTNHYPDHVYAVTPHASGNLVITLTAPPTGSLANFMIVARRTCNTPETDATLCANAAASGAGETLTVAVTKDEPLYVAIDGGATTNNTGDYTLSFELQP